VFNSDSDLYSTLVAGAILHSVQQSVKVGHANDMNRQTAYLVQYARTYIGTFSPHEYSRHTYGNTVTLMFTLFGCAVLLHINIGVANILT
jgi:hypothetical protein